MRVKVRGVALAAIARAKRLTKRRRCGIELMIWTPISCKLRFSMNRKSMRPSKPCEEST
jgi:hypothetical protein